jgi:hypothetical protein
MASEKDPRLTSPAYRGKKVVGILPIAKTRFQIESDRVRELVHDVTDGTHETESEEFDYRLKVTRSHNNLSIEMTKFRGEPIHSMTLKGAWGSNAYYQAVAGFMWQFEVSLGGWVPPPVG